MKKTTFFVRIFDISAFVFTQILSRRAHWMQNLIPRPTSTHTTYFWWALLPPKKRNTWKKCDDDIIIMLFSGISYFWGSRVHQKYAVWLLVGCEIKFHIQRVPTQYTFDRPRYPKNKKYLEKCDDDVIIMFFHVFLVFGVP